MYEKHIFVCENQRDGSDPRGCCKSRGGAEFLTELKRLCKEAGLARKVRVNKSGCLDFCSAGPVAVVYPEGVWYKGLTTSDAQEIFSEHIVGGCPVERLRFRSRAEAGDVKS